MLALAAALPFSLFHATTVVDFGIPIQWFGVVVATGVLIGATILRRYAEWHGVSDEHVRGITGWITVAGFIGAHLFDVIAYQWHDVQRDPLLIVEVWKGISSFGGFIGGAVGFAIYVWWKRLPVRLMADVAIAGLMPAFTIGRIGCSIVSDHIGSFVDPHKWYAFLAVDYPRSYDPNALTYQLSVRYPDTGDFIRAWNLGLVEFLYLVPVCALILWLAFRTKQRPNSGLLAVVAGLLYSPVRFFLDFLRPEDTDPRHAGLTFAQWGAMLAFGAAVYVAVRVLKSGEAAEVVAPTSGEAQERIKMALRMAAEGGDKADTADEDDAADDKK
jgi:phosphatidylglycerol---prolipoprotein diacylglyceryl transferase